MMTIPALALVVVCGPRTNKKRIFLNRHFAKSAILSDDDVAVLALGQVAARGDTRVPESRRSLLEGIIHYRLTCGQRVILDVEDEHDPLVRLACEAAESLWVYATRIRLNGAGTTPLKSASSPPTVDAELGDTPRAPTWHATYDIALDDARPMQIQTTRLPCDHRRRTGIFHVIADVEGCVDELIDLVQILGYAVNPTALTVRAPNEQTLVFCGNVLGSGPSSFDAYLIASQMCEAGQALYVPGPNEESLLAALRDSYAPTTAWVQAFLCEADRAGTEREAIRAFLTSLPSHIILDDGQLIVASHPLSTTMHGRFHPQVRQTATQRWREAASATARATTTVVVPETPADNKGPVLALTLPTPTLVASNDRARGTERPTAVFVGQKPVSTPQWDGLTLAINTSVVYGGALTAVTWPDLTVRRCNSAETGVEHDAGDSVALTWEETWDGEHHDTALLGGFDAAFSDEDEEEDALDGSVYERRVDGWMAWWTHVAEACATWATPHPLRAPDAATALHFSKILYFPAPQVDIHSGAVRAVVALRRPDTLTEYLDGRENVSTPSYMYDAAGCPVVENAHAEAQLLASVARTLERAGVYVRLRASTLYLDCTYAGPLHPETAEALRQARQRATDKNAMTRARARVLRRRGTPATGVSDLTFECASETLPTITLHRILATGRGCELQRPLAWQIDRLTPCAPDGPRSLTRPAQGDAQSACRLLVDPLKRPSFYDDQNNRALIDSFFEGSDTVAHARRVHDTRERLMFFDSLAVPLDRSMGNVSPSDRRSLMRPRH